MAYKIWGTKYELFNKEGIVNFFIRKGVNSAAQLLSEAEVNRKASVNINGMKVMILKY